MALPRTMLLALVFGILFSTKAKAQPGDRSMNTEARVLDLIFPLDVTPKPYFLKMILRFSDSDTQVVVVVYPDEEKYWVKRCEIIRYSLAGMGDGELSQLISTMEAENPKVKDQEIAAKVKVRVTRSPVAPEALNHALVELRAVRISPLLADRVCVDQCPEFEYWYDNWQESVHYTLVGDVKSAPQDDLVQWMVKFKDNLPNLLKASLEATPAKPSGVAKSSRLSNSAAFPQ